MTHRRTRRYLRGVLPEQASLRGVAFSSPTDAWAFGGAGIGPAVRLFVLRSRDAGMTWSEIDPFSDVDENRLVESIMWSDARHGWASIPFAEPFLPIDDFPDDCAMATADGGETWSPAGPRVDVTLCDGRAQCVSADDTTDLGPAPGSERFCDGELPFHARAHDLRASGEGVACDNWVCWYTTDAGQTWTESRSRPDLDGEPLPARPGRRAAPGRSPWGRRRGSPASC